MKTYMLLLSLLVSTVKLTAQPDIAWMRDAGAPSHESGKSVTTDPSGNVYVTGSIITTSTFDNIQVNAYYDGFLAKYNQSGIVQWVKTMGGSGSADITITKVKSDADGNIYLCGRFGFRPLFPTVTFDAITVTATAPYQEFAFLAKYNAAGNIQWLRYGGGNPSHAVFYDLDFDNAGNIYLCGDFTDYATFNGQTLTASFTVSNAGMWVKYDSNGNVVHLAQTSSNTRSELYAVEVSQSTGTIFLAGIFKDAITFNGTTTLPVGNSQNTFLVSFDDSYNFNWIRNGGGSTFQSGTTVQAIEIDHQDNIYLTGNAIGTLVQFGNLSYSGTSAFDGEIMTIKYNASGVEQWLKHGGGATSGDALDMITDKQGNTIITGFLNGNVLFATFDNYTIQILSQSPHCFLVKYDANGNVVYAKRMGLGNDEYGRGLAFANDTTFYLTGTTQGLTQFDTLVFTASFPDPNIFIAKFYDNTTPGGSAEICNGLDDDGNGIVDDNAIAFINPSDDITACKGEAVLLATDEGAGLSYQWLKNGNAVSGATNHSYTTTQGGNFSVTVNSSTGCLAASEEVNINRLANPTATITPLGDLDICTTGSVNLEANAGPGYQYQWFKKKQLIEGATAQIYTATKETNFKVEVTNSNGCSKLSQNVTIINSCKLTTENMIQDAQVHIYPNPMESTALLNFSLTENSTISIDLLDIQGRIIKTFYSGELPGGTHQLNLDLSAFEAGIYFCKIKSNNYLSIVKLTKSK